LSKWNREIIEGNSLLLVITYGNYLPTCNSNGPITAVMAMVKINEGREGSNPDIRVICKVKRLGGPRERPVSA
jgi:hypothetical protein